MKSIYLLLCAALIVAFGGVPRGDSQEANTDAFRRLSTEHLQNPIRLHPKVISGGLSAGEESFEELQQLCIKTIISVDSAKPDIETAAKYGLRYVHLPHGYDGISDTRVKELAKAVRDLDGPIYIHCHHGRHRSPAAAAVACISAGLLPSTVGIDVLKFAGTSPQYRGLFDSVRRARPLSATVLDTMDAEFPEHAEVPKLAEAMVGINRSFEHLQWIAEAQWRTPEDHPDLEPEHEALILREQLAELLRADFWQHEEQDFEHYLRETVNSARSLEGAIHQWQTKAPNAPPPDSLSKFAEQVKSNCIDCHRDFR